MPITLQDTETETEVILIWIGKVGDVLPNGSGVRHTHNTNVVVGCVSIHIEGQEAQVLTAPVTIVLPINTPYTVTVVEDAEIHCHYPKAIEGAVEEISHLRGDAPYRVA